MESTKNIEVFKPILEKIGFILEAEQLHMSGERFLMMKYKSVLLGKDSHGRKVIIKITNHPDGKKEINHEKLARDLLGSAVFSNDTLLFPKEVYSGEKEGYRILVTEFISQDKVFVEHTIEEQFFLILRAFEEQEAFHATTFEHLKMIDKFFPVYHAKEYFETFKTFQKKLESLKNSDLNQTLEQTYAYLTSNKQTIDAFSNYLTHTDFVPHNFRVKGRKIYMLDLAAVHFGNKYEGWARFINYMVIHNPKLAKLLIGYIKENRTEKDSENLKLMRVYKIAFLLDFYTQSLDKTEGDLKQLTSQRIDFWHKVLKLVLNDEDIPDELVEIYKSKRNTLRSDEEKKRQREFAVA